MGPCPYSDPRATRLLPSLGHAALPLALALVTITLVGCSSSPSKLRISQSDCLSTPDRPSCFYVEAPESKNKKLIIFVPGVFDSKVTTWGDPLKPTFWPAMVAQDPHFAKYDIYLINYSRPIVDESPNIHETASNELERLSSLKVFERYHEIYLIAHSMGGLVTKSMLTQLNRGEAMARLHQIKGVVYLSTPAQGTVTDSTFLAKLLSPRGFYLESTSDTAITGMGIWNSLWEYPFRILTRRGNSDEYGVTGLWPYGEPKFNEYITALEDKWIQLIEDRDAAKVEYPQAFCAYETHPIRFELVVPKELASSRCDEPLYLMPFDHFRMALPTQRNEDPYLWAMGKILDAGSSGITRRQAKALLQSAEESVIAGKLAAARRAYDEARTLYRKTNDRQGEANVLTGLGDLERVLNRPDEARTAYREARSLFKTGGNRLGEANVLTGLGDLERVLNHPDEARTAYREARSLFKVEGNRLGEANVLTVLGNLEARQGRSEEARTAYIVARSFFKAEGNRLGEANVLTSLGKLEGFTKPDLARQYFHQAAFLYEQIGMNGEKERALNDAKNVSR